VAEASSDSPWWHIVWVTCRAWPPTDRRGDWRDLAVLYLGLADTGLAVEMSDPLPGRWQRRPLLEGVVRLPPNAWELLAADLSQLVSSDRIAGGPPIRSLAVGPTSVQLLLSCPPASLHQRVGRLKSRSATQLKFRQELGVGGAGTWGKGFWWARFSDEAVIDLVANFISDRVPRRIRSSTDL
jgi:hypothetical protein